jgi:hypothetical protein
MRRQTKVIWDSLLNLIIILSGLLSYLASPPTSYPQVENPLTLFTDFNLGQIHSLLTLPIS